MEHFIRIAFWIGTLSGCLQAHALPIRDFGEQLLRKNVKCPEDSTFYSPNLETGCITEAMDCVIKELHGTVKTECLDLSEPSAEDLIGHALQFLDDMVKSRTPRPTLSDECKCERMPQVSFSEFLNNTMTLLQKGQSAQWS